MRSVCRARWATCALAPPILALLIAAISVSASAHADRPRRSIADCARFEQADTGDERVSFTIHNGCSIPLDCAVSWRVVCAPDARKRRAVHPGSVKLAIADGSRGSAEASAAICGDDAWSIDSVQWSCVPNKD